MNYDWSWMIFLAPSPSGASSYLQMFVHGLYWTLSVAAFAWAIALVVGTMVGVGRTSHVRSVRRICTAYVEVFRNIPLLVQLFLWYFVIPNVVPSSVGDLIKRSNPTWNSYGTAVLCLGLYTAPRIAEQLRAGIGSLPRGQTLAALALGLRRHQVYGQVLLPLTVRIIMPPLTSETMNLVKNTSVAFTIGLLAITGVAKAMADFSFHIFEAFSAATILYLLINGLVVLVMRYIEKHIAIPGFAGAAR